MLDDTRLVLPEYRGNGVHASLGNIPRTRTSDCSWSTLSRDLIGLHVNGRARIVSDAWLRDAEPDLPVDGAPGRRARHWLLVEVEEAYVHCCKHIPRMVVVPRRRSWGSNDAARFRRRCVRSRAETSLAEPRHATTRNSADGAQAVRTVASGAVDRRRKSNRRSGLFMSRVRKWGRLVKQRMN